MLIKDHREERINLHLQQEQETMARSGAQKRKAAKIRKQKEAQTSNNNGVSPQASGIFCSSTGAAKKLMEELLWAFGAV
ncbi:hypothetical protein Nepgr_007019 [Nepenthes gracilis]|uniref:Uncharacterized protein n=1 Tax=Nepenthes gracilis TaxID=150966 RepID=A0AAD3S6A7_NEPGR|nr:hypothetical protein Nepgr_007019 [Nepenthes gracilis]